MRESFFKASGHSRLLRGQKGQTLVILVLSVALLTAFSGVAIDGANLFLKKLQLRHALDAGAMAGITNLDTQFSDARTAEITEQMARFNLEHNGIQPANILSIEPGVDFRPADGIMTVGVRGTIRVRTLFISLVMPQHRMVNVTAFSKAVRPKVIASLVLDITPTMAPNIQQLKRAAIAFISALQTNFDEVAIVSFSTKARIVHQMGIFADKQKLIDAINGLAAIGPADLPNTNIASGVEAGRFQVEQATAVPPDSMETMIVFTDGSPTAILGRFFTNHDEAKSRKLQPHTETDAAIAPTDAPYQYYSLFWRPPDANNNEGELKHTFLLDENEGRIDQPCGDADKWCLNDYIHVDSRGNLSVMGDTADQMNDAYQINNNDPNVLIKQNHYDLALVEADYAKDENVTIHVIALGAEAGPFVGDPLFFGGPAYQNVQEAELIKPYFLRRLANDRRAVNDPQFLEPAVPAIDPAHRNGTYSQTTDPNELQNLFMRTLNRIRVRLLVE